MTSRELKQEIEGKNLFSFLILVCCLSEGEK